MMNDHETLDESEAAIEGLFNDFKNSSFPEGWESALLEAAGPATIRLAPEPSAPTLPAPPRIHAPASFWTRHRLTVARVAAAAVLLTATGVLLRLVPSGSDLEAASEVSATTSIFTTTTTEPSEAAAGEASIPSEVTTTTAVSDPPTTPTAALEESVLSTSSTSTTTTPPTTPQTTTVASPDTAVAVPTDPTVTTQTTVVDPSTTAVSTTVPSSTVTTTVVSTTAPSTTSTTKPVAADVVIRDLAIVKISTDSAVVSFRTNDCAGARFQVTGGVSGWAHGYPNQRQCLNDHIAVLGTAPYTNGELEPGKKYSVKITTFAADGTTATARTSFSTLPLEIVLPPVLDTDVDDVDPADDDDPDRDDEPTP